MFSFLLIILYFDYIFNEPIYAGVFVMWKEPKTTYNHINHIVHITLKQPRKSTGLKFSPQTWNQCFLFTLDMHFWKVISLTWQWRELLSALLKTMMPKFKCSLHIFRRTAKFLINLKLREMFFSLTYFSVSWCPRLSLSVCSEWTSNMYYSVHW